jgi:CHAT domain-containing protein
MMRSSASALLLHPERRLLSAPPNDPLARWVARAREWRIDEDGLRTAELVGGGSLTESAGPARGEHVRLLHHAAQGTLRALYRDGRCVSVAELWSAGDIMVQRTLEGCELAFLSACGSATGALASDYDEQTGLPSALQLAGVATVVGALWPVSDALTALYVDLFYEQLAQSLPVADVAAVVRRTGEELRAMTRRDVAARLAEIEGRTSDPAARFHLEAFAAEIEGRGARPFAHPCDWAAFYVTGAGDVAFG